MARTFPMFAILVLLSQTTAELSLVLVCFYQITMIELTLNPIQSFIINLNLLSISYLTFSVSEEANSMIKEGSSFREEAVKHLKLFEV
jgi:hypothetical protein